MSDFIINIVAVIIGGIITWLVSWYVSKKFYLRAGKDLKGEVSKLEKLSNMILRVMEDEGWVELNTDVQGNIQGFVRKLSGSSNIKSEIHGEAIIEKPKTPKEQ